MTQQPSSDRLEQQRASLRDALQRIVDDIGTEMRTAGLNFPIFIAVRNEGPTLATAATPLDPSDQDWDRAFDIVLRTIEERIGCGRLRGQTLTCAVANAAMSAAEVVTGSSASEPRDSPSIAEAR